MRICGLREFARYKSPELIINNIIIIIIIGVFSMILILGVLIDSWGESTSIG